MCYTGRIWENISCEQSGPLLPRTAMNGSTAPARKKMTHTQRELSLTHKANSEEQPQTRTLAANRPAEVSSWANPREHDTRRDAPGRS